VRRHRRGRLPAAPPWRCGGRAVARSSPMPAGPCLGVHHMRSPAAPLLEPEPGFPFVACWFGGHTLLRRVEGVEVRSSRSRSRPAGGLHRPRNCSLGYPGGRSLRRWPSADDPTCSVPLARSPSGPGLTSASPGSRRRGLAFADRALTADARRCRAGLRGGGVDAGDQVPGPRASGGARWSWPAVSARTADSAASPWAARRIRVVSEVEFCTTTRMIACSAS